MPYAQLQQFLDEEYPRGRHYYWKSAALAELSDAVIDVVAEYAATQPSPLSTIDVWVMGGALRDEPPGGSAYSGPLRRAIWSIPRPTGTTAPTTRPTSPGRDSSSRRSSRHTVGNYLNFPGLLEEGEKQLRASFGAHYERLVDVKTRWDPDNVFRLNHNVSRRAVWKRRRRALGPGRSEEMV